MRRLSALSAVPLILAWTAAAVPAAGQELPVPSMSNSLIISIEHSPADAAEVEAILKSIPFGLYAWPSFSITTLAPAMPWTTPLHKAEEALEPFRAQVAGLVDAAKARGVRLHLVLVSGLARTRSVFRDAKIEDIRNAQWYNDNKLIGDDLAKGAGFIDDKAFGTLSRYARKVRAHLEVKARAALTHLAGVIAAEPETLLAVSGWGEAELNFNRMVPTQSLQPHFCDYSPFAVLEFRDWIRHEGEYDDAAGLYRGQGWDQGGDRYRGPDGLARFNADFGTAFTTWDLRYFNWSLADDYGADPTAPNRDPRIIPLAAYVHGGMMPESGPAFIPHGFDPPRAMKPGDRFWDLWNLFRETMVHAFVRDAAQWASESGIPADRWYSHQIPGDYLFNTNPGVPDKNARYSMGASPLWTADVAPYGKAGATIYDIRFPGWFARTTEYAVPAVAALSRDWAIMEFDPETYPAGMEIVQSPPEDMLKIILRVYDHGARLINFWRWWDETKEHRIKGMNKEAALREFVRLVRDKARARDLRTVYDPPRVGEAAVRRAGSGGVSEVVIPERIWPGERWTWKEWGDFDRFDIYRSESPGPPAAAGTLIGSTKDYVYRDTTAAAGKTYVYRVRAVNRNGVRGPA